MYTNKYNQKKQLIIDADANSQNKYSTASTKNWQSNIITNIIGTQNAIRILWIKYK